MDKGADLYAGLFVAQISELTSEYYHLVPRTGYSFERIAPLDNEHMLAQEWDHVDMLLELEVAGKMLTAAQNKVKGRVKIGSGQTLLKVIGQTLLQVKVTAFHMLQGHLLHMKSQGHSFDNARSFMAHGQGHSLNVEVSQSTRVKLIVRISQLYN